MDEYIKKDDAIRAALNAAARHTHSQFCAVDIAAAINELPAADVVPKKTLELSQHLLGDAWKNIDELGELCGELQKAKSEAAREIFEEIEKILVRSESPTALFYHCGKHSYAELKRKYTEGEK